MSNIDIDKFNAVQDSLSKEDAKGGKTRPRITWLMAILFTAFYVTYMVSMVMGVVKGQIELPGWEAITALLGLPAFVLRSYFNNRTQDKKTRAAAGLGINPNTPSTLDKVIGALAAKYLKVDIDKST
tara:strand:+ start:3032 stop:3412 length:381 start_codon:yes stop_codon:yes gene_type:complete